MGILQLLAKENYITYHKAIAKIVGVDESILFGELCSMSNLYGYEFFCEQGKLMNDTCLSEYRLRNALKNLQKVGLLSVTKKGLPAKNYYILNEDKLLEILKCHRTSSIKFDRTGDSEFDGTGTSKIDSTFIKNTISKNTESKNTKERKNSSYDEILSSIENDSLRELYYEYIKMRKMIKAPMTDRALKMLIDKVNKLEPSSIDNKKKLLENAILNNWKSVYPLKEDQRVQPRSFRGEQRYSAKDEEEIFEKPKMLPTDEEIASFKEQIKIDYPDLEPRRYEMMVESFSKGEWE